MCAAKAKRETKVISRTRRVISFFFLEIMLNFQFLSVGSSSNFTTYTITAQAAYTWDYLVSIFLYLKVSLSIL